ncbi:ATPase [Rhodococcus sp. SC4]|nr:ATPase [Rhodococcus sp. SC4]
MTTAPATRTGDLAAIRTSVASQVVGRERELDLVLAAVAAGRDLILEGPPGTSKSTILRTITNHSDIPLILVEGNADLTPGRLVGHHNPSRVLREDYSADNFVDGPLVEAMRKGGFLYIEEFNRAPEDTIDTLLTAMAERVVTVPRVGTVTALPTFRIVASMNPYDNIGTTRLSTSVYDRMCRLVVDYQDADAEREIVARRAHPVPVRIIADVVAVTRATRNRDDIRQGSSVRGAIDLALVIKQLCAMHDVAIPQNDSLNTPRDLPTDYTTACLDSMLIALSGRIHLDDITFASAEEVLTEIWQDHFLLNPAAADPG